MSVQLFSLVFLISTQLISSTKTGDTCKRYDNLSKEEERMENVNIKCLKENLAPEHKACFKKVYGVSDPGSNVAEYKKMFCSPPNPAKENLLLACQAKVPISVTAVMLKAVVECVKSNTGSNVPAPGSGPGPAPGSGPGSAPGEDPSSDTSMVKPGFVFPVVIFSTLYLIVKL